MTRPLIFLFPGQSSWDGEVFDRLQGLDGSLGRSARNQFQTHTGRSFDGTLESNLEIQVAVFLLTNAYREILASHHLEAQDSAGLSLGEYNNLVHIGALSESEALPLVAARGRAYDAGPTGEMAAIYPASAGDVETLVVRVREELNLEEGDLAVSNYNSPRQVVVAGRREGVERVVSSAEEELYAMAKIIEKRIPMHVKRFSSVATAFRPELERVDWGAPTKRWWSNVLGGVAPEPNKNQFVDLMTRHVCEPVQWIKTIEGLMASYDTPLFVEVGPKTILADLLGGWRPKIPCVSTDGAHTSVSQLIEEIRDARNGGPRATSSSRAAS